MAGSAASEDRRFVAASDYHELNAGAHRNPPKVLTAPALVWHLAFWTSDEPDQQKKGRQKTLGEVAAPRDSQQSRNTRIKSRVDDFILTLCRGLEDNKEVSGLQLFPRVGDVRLLFNTLCRTDSFSPLKDTPPQGQRQKDVFSSTSRAVGVQFAWNKLDVAIRFEVHTEYFSISTFVELDSKHNKPLDKPEEYSGIDELNSKIVVARNFLNERNTPAGAKQRDDDTADSINAYFFHAFWKNFEKEFYLAPIAHSQQDKLFSRVFADFRGLVLSEQAVEFAQYKEAFKGNRRLTWGQDAKVAFLPFIQHRELNSRYECTINYMLDGRGLYMSTLGPQSPSIPDDQRIPVEFIVYTPHHFPRTQPESEASDPPKTVVNKWQRGRLISQILLLGTLRLCALKDVKLLHDAGRDLAGLDESMQIAREAIARSEADAISANRDNAGGEINGTKPAQASDAKAGAASKSNAPRTDASFWSEIRPVLSGKSGVPAVKDKKAEGGRDRAAAADDMTVIQSIATAHEKLNKITGTFLDESGSGLLYRIERSRYYVQQFEDNVKLLRISRVEGNQPYDQFIKRRLGSEFDFIDRLGIRYERATNNAVSLDQNYLAITQNALVKQANRIDEETKGIQGDIHAIQLWGEFALLAALVPYYVMHLLDLVIQEELVPAMTLSVWTIFGAIALYRMFKRYSYSMALILIIIVVVCVRKFDLFDYSNMLRFPEKPGEQLSTQKEMLEIQKKLETLQEQQLTILRELLQSQNRPYDAPKDNAPSPAPAAPPPKH